MKLLNYARPPTKHLVYAVVLSEEGFVIESAKFDSAKKVDTDILAAYVPNVFKALGYCSGAIKECCPAQVTAEFEEYRMVAMRQNEKESANYVCCIFDKAAPLGVCITAAKKVNEKVRKGIKTI